MISLLSNLKKPNNILLANLWTFYLNKNFMHFFCVYISKITKKKYELGLNSGNLDSSYHIYFLQTELYQYVI